MKSSIGIIVGIFCLSWAGNLFGQNPLPLRFMPEEISAQAYQPAFIAWMPENQLSLGGHAGYTLQSNIFNMDLLFSEDRFLDDARKNELIEGLGVDNRFTLRAHWDAHLNLPIGKQVLALSTSQRLLTHLAFHDPASMKLLLYGNAPFAGQTLSDQDIRFQNVAYQEIAIGTALRKGKFSFGGKVKLLLGSRSQILSDLDYQLTTAPLGTSLDLETNYQFFQAQSTGLAGWGLGIDLGGVYEYSPKWRFQWALLDLGRIRWQGERFDQESSLTYEGVEITDLFDVDVSNLGNLIPADTLQGILIAEAVEGSENQGLPTRIDLGANYQLSPQDQLQIGLLWGLPTTATGNYLPVVSLGYRRQLGKYLQLGAHAYRGDVEQYGLGLFARGEATLAQKARISLFYSLDNGVGLLSPKNAGALSMHAGLSLSWL